MSTRDGTQSTDASADAATDARLISDYPVERTPIWRQSWVIVNAWRAVLFVVVILVWWLAAGRWLDTLYTSTPKAVWDQLMGWVADGTLWFHTWITVQESLLGLVFGISAGVIAGFVVGPLHTLGKVIDPYLLALYSIPKLALAPLFLVWFGVGINMKVILSAVIVFFLVFFNTVAGVRAVDPDLVAAVRLMGGTTRHVAQKVMVPAAAGMVLTGIRIAIPYALIGAVVGELIASNRGLGYLVRDSSARLNTAGVFAALIALMLISTVLNAIVNRIEKSGMPGSSL